MTTIRILLRAIDLEPGLFMYILQMKYTIDKINSIYLVTRISLFPARPDLDLVRFGADEVAAGGSPSRPASGYLHCVPNVKGYPNGRQVTPSRLSGCIGH